MNDKKHSRIMEILETENALELEQLSYEISDFPNGKDNFSGRYWIINAIDYGSFFTIKWMLDNNADIDFVDEGGYTVLSSAMERANLDRYDVLKLLLEHGADVNLCDSSGVTAAHNAVYLDDVKALEILQQYGADFTLKTNVDNFTTPLEEAKYLNKEKSIKFLEKNTQ